MISTNIPLIKLTNGEFYRFLRQYTEIYVPTNVTKIKYGYVLMLIKIPTFYGLLYEKAAK